MRTASIERSTSSSPAFPLARSSSISPAAAAATSMARLFTSATACVSALSQRLLDTGHAFCALFADLANPASNSIYQKIGYRPVGDFAEFDFPAA